MPTRQPRRTTASTASTSASGSQVSVPEKAWSQAYGSSVAPASRPPSSPNFTPHTPSQGSELWRQSSMTSSRSSTWAALVMPSAEIRARTRVLSAPASRAARSIA